MWKSGIIKLVQAEGKHVSPRTVLLTNNAWRHCDVSLVILAPFTTYLLTLSRLSFLSVLW